MLLSLSISPKNQPVITWLSPLPSGSEYVIEVVTVVPEIRDPVKAGSEKIAALLAAVINPIS